MHRYRYIGSRYVKTARIMACVDHANDPNSVSGMFYTVSQAEIQLERDAMQFICMYADILTFLRLLLPKAEMKRLEYEK